MQYCKRFNRFENVEAVKAVRDLLSRVEESFGEGRYFYDFEVCLCVQLCRVPAFAPQCLLAVAHTSVDLLLTFHHRPMEWQCRWGCWGTLSLTQHRRRGR